MEDIIVDVCDVLMRLYKLDVNKSARPLYSCILYEAREQLAYPLTVLLESSHQDKQLPEDWCSANVVPVFKKGDKNSPSITGRSL